MYVRPFCGTLLPLILRIGGLLSVVAHPSPPPTPKHNSICVDQIYPTHERVRVACPWDVDDIVFGHANNEPIYKNLVSADTLHSAPVQIDFQCHHAAATNCEKAQRTFERAGAILTNIILFREPIRVNATLLSFCKGGGECGKNMMTLGGSSPARSMPLVNADGVLRMHPQALVKQFGMSGHSAFAPYDILSIFNADAPFWYEDDEKPIQPDQVDFLFVILHEFMHGLGFYSGWDEYMKPLPVLTPDPSPLLSNGLILMVNSITGSISASHFLESALDRMVVLLDSSYSNNDSMTALSNLTNTLNQIQADSLKNLVFSSDFSLAFTMDRLATTPGTLGVALFDDEGRVDDIVVLETTLSPFKPGSSISHVDYATYANSPDFLMRFMQNRGVTLAECVIRSGGQGPIGPKLMRILEQLGYSTTRLPNVVPPLLLFQNTSEPTTTRLDPFIRHLSPLRSSANALAPCWMISVAVAIVMGKQKHKRKAAKLRATPIGVRGPSKVENAVEKTTDKDQIFPIVKKLTSSNETERAWAAASMSNLVAADPQTRKVLYANNIVQLLIERLGDTHHVVIEESLGALRNLVSMDATVAKELYAKNILTPLRALLPKISQIIDQVLSDAPCEKPEELEIRRTVWDMAENFIYIIWVISETTIEYIKAVNRLNVVPFLLSFLSAADKCPPSVVLAAGQCLMTLTDDNTDIYIEWQNHREYTELLFNVLKSCDAPSRKQVCVLACAILLNVREAIVTSESWDEETDVFGELSKSVLPILIATLNFDIQAAASQPAAKDIKRDMMILQLALELLSDVCAEDDSEEDGWVTADVEMEDDDEEDKIPEADDDENIDEYLDDMNDVNEGTMKTADAMAARSNPVLQTIVNQVVPHLFRLATPAPQSFSTQPDGSQAIALIHLRALECLNNFLLTINEIPGKFWFVEHQSDAIQAWRWLFDTANTVALKAQKEIRDALLEIIVSCLWAVGRGLGQAIPAESADVAALFEVYRSVDSETMQVKVIGCLSSIAMRKGHVDMNKDIGCFVLEIVKAIEQRKTRADPAVEALNFFYDVYSDKAFDYDEPVFVQGHFLEPLRRIVKPVQQMVKSIDRRKNYDLRLRGDEALSNLTRFIKYKAHERL